MKHFFLLIFFSFFIISCSKKVQALKEKSYLSFSKTYDKYVENEFDYDGRDTILKRFKNELSTALNDEALKKYYFPKWDKKRAISVSKDSTLTILSWDWENNGTFHRYESMYRLVKNNKIYTGFLFEHDGGQKEIFSTVYYKSYSLPNSSFLVKGWGTHGGGKEFFVFRNLKLKNGRLQDCLSCFNGENQLFYEITRGKDNLEPKFDAVTNEISYHELTENFVDGDKDSPSGFMDATGKILRLQYKDGEFVKPNN